MMRFDPTDPTRQLSVDWYFTDPAAKWIGYPNVFDSRNWYAGVDDWPQLGEVQGAPRPWRDGSSPAVGLLDGPHGTRAQWLEGAPFSQWVTPPLCNLGRIAVPFPENGGTVHFLSAPMQPTIALTQFTSDRWGWYDPFFGSWFSIDRDTPGACGYPSSLRYGYALGPGGDIYFELSPAEVFGQCANYVLFGPAALGWAYVPNPLT